MSESILGHQTLIIIYNNVNIVNDIVITNLVIPCISGPFLHSLGQEYMLTSQESTQPCRRSELSTEDGIDLLGARVVVQPTLWKDVLRVLHADHPGIATKHKNETAPSSIGYPDDPHAKLSTRLSATLIELLLLRRVEQCHPQLITLTVNNCKAALIHQFYKAIASLSANSVSIDAPLN
ncbi:hypothetical protein GJ496_005225 [Pomphorhynchus laevis]|nr:hypothetical protein GJ496_009569 [Pomphorhynchus laevis]KAI0978451.1 hypothetical protein GJ496_003961 [Pomphorhynchus laevis]KAI0988025.1 hypothetical protein GJ496_005225 [Pomphorhynchus laevis]